MCCSYLEAVVPVYSKIDSDAWNLEADNIQVVCSVSFAPAWLPFLCISQHVENIYLLFMLAYLS